MYSNCYLGAPGLGRLRCQNEALSARVLDEVSINQELVTLNKFEHQSSEYLLRQCLQERIADLESWRWVLQDLSNRLNDVVQELRYEYKALRVVLQRIQEEIDRHSEEASRPGALTPQRDPVEDAIIQEHKFLLEQKKKFEKIIEELDVEIPSLEKTQKRIQTAALNKEQAIHVEEKLPNLDISSANPSNNRRKKRSLSPLSRWESQCHCQKRKGLTALSHALTIRQQVRGARSLLTVTAQSHAARVNSLLKRRLYLNTRRLEDLKWQKEEAQQDYKALADELTTTEQSVLETLDKIRLMEARLADRGLRPPKEQTKDVVDRKLKDELNRLKQFLNYLRSNINRITSLQGDLTAAIAQMNCVEEDVTQVIDLDKDRIRSRSSEDDAPPPANSNTGSGTSPANSNTSSGTSSANSNTSSGASTAAGTSSSLPSNESRNTRLGDIVLLRTIAEVDETGEEEEDDYPLDY